MLANGWVTQLLMTRDQCSFRLDLTAQTVGPQGESQELTLELGLGGLVDEVAVGIE